jgi:hypothetical protein
MMSLSQPRRPVRSRRAPKRYWDEYVAKDDWYVHKLVEDVPADELHAAIVDENLSSDPESASEEEEVDTASDMESFIEEDEMMAEDTDFEPSNLSDASSSSDESEDNDTSSDSSFDSSCRRRSISSTGNSGDP